VVVFVSALSDRSVPPPPPPSPPHPLDIQSYAAPRLLRQGCSGCSRRASSAAGGGGDGRPTCTAPLRAFGGPTRTNRYADLRTRDEPGRPVSESHPDGEQGKYRWVRRESGDASLGMRNRHTVYPFGEARDVPMHLLITPSVIALGRRCVDPDLCLVKVSPPSAGALHETAADNDGCASRWIS
jgi:hypothetical protein